MLAIAWLAACQFSPATSEAHAAEPPQVHASDAQMEKQLASHLWQLTAFFEQNIPTTGNTNLNFMPQNKSISGSAGCNRYFGSYTLHQGKLSFSQLGSTKMMCMDRTEEDAFFKHIGQVTRFKLNDDILTLFDRNIPVMQFTAQTKSNSH